MEEAGIPPFAQKGCEQQLRHLGRRRLDRVYEWLLEADAGLKGGSDAQPGRNWVERIDGTREILTATESADVGVGDRFVIETPGGGGFGSVDA